MEDYRKKVISNMIVGGIIITIAVCLCVFDLLIDLELISFKPENIMLLNFQTGFLLGIGMVALITMFRCGKALKSPEKLQIMYNQEYDERQAFIRQKAGMPMLSLTSGAMVLAGIIAGYFNDIVFYTLIAAAMAQLVISVLVKLYYTKTM
jgi:hypothetical protein